MRKAIRATLPDTPFALPRRRDSSTTSRHPGSPGLSILHVSSGAQAICGRPARIASAESSELGPDYGIIEQMDVRSILVLDLRGAVATLGVGDLDHVRPYNASQRAGLESMPLT